MLEHGSPQDEEEDDYDLHHLLLDLLLALVLGDRADEQAAVVQAHAHADELARPYLVVVQHLDGTLGCLAGRVHDEGVAAVLAAELHHQAELIDAASTLEHGHQLVLVHVPWDLAHKNFAAPRRRRAFPT